MSFRHFPFAQASISSVTRPRICFAASGAATRRRATCGATPSWSGRHRSDPIDRHAVRSGAELRLHGMAAACPRLSHDRRHLSGRRGGGASVDRNASSAAARGRAWSAWQLGAADVVCGQPRAGSHHRDASRARRHRCAIRIRSRMPPGAARRCTTPPRVRRSSGSGIGHGTVRDPERRRVVVTSSISAPS